MPSSAASFPPKTFVPLHSHPDRETVLVVESELMVWLASSWRTFGPGEIVEIRSNALHAVKKEGPEEVALVLITTATVASFLAEISVPGRDAVVSTARLAQVARTRLCLRLPERQPCSSRSYRDASPGHE
jgi:hypothetical protein